MVPRGPALRALLEAAPLTERDRIADELLGFGPPPADGPLPRGAVPYLPCGVTELLAMVRGVPIGPSATLLDVGAGVGRAAILVHLVSGARTAGIELQPALVAEARAHVARLGLAGVTVEEGDALAAPLVGDIVFLYAPFNGELLRRFIARLAQRPRPFVLCTVDLALDEPWLVRRAAGEGALAIYDVA